MTNSSLHRIFVYGSLRSGFKSPAYEYISRYFTFLAEGRVPGLLYDLGEYPAAIPAGTDQFIVGELYEAREGDQFEYVIGQLDDYEGVLVEEGEQPLYRRERTMVFTPQGATEAWVYWYNGDVSGKPLVASGDMVQYLQEKLRQQP
ncbi:MAG: gamma-glutamylcyclotransferase [Chitinophagaceae bacterium]